jgi:hypothetical protein
MQGAGRRQFVVKVPVTKRKTALELWAAFREDIVDRFDLSVEEVAAIAGWGFSTARTAMLGTLPTQARMIASLKAALIRNQGAKSRRDLRLPDGDEGNSR